MRGEWIAGGVWVLMCGRLSSTRLGDGGLSVGFGGESFERFGFVEALGLGLCYDGFGFED